MNILILFLALTIVACKKGEGSDIEPDDNSDSNIERIALLVDYESGYGGYIYPVYNPYVFFKNGMLVKEPKIPVGELNLEALDTDQATDWGTWKLAGDKVQITYADGDTSEKEWPGSDAYPAKNGETLNGSFSSISGGGTLAFGGDIGVVSYSSMSFTPDGWYTTESVGGGSSSSSSAYHTSTTSGKYTIDGEYQITLTANNGQVSHFFFCWYSENGEDGVFRLGGRTFVEED